MNKLIIYLSAILFSVLSLFSGQLSASVIAQIEFVGNEITREHVLLQEMRSRIGDELDIQTVHEDLQAIMDLSLFREVKYYLFAADDLKEGHVKLVIEVKEKYYLFILPEIRGDEEDKKFRYGLQAYWDNIRGYNHSLRLNVIERGITLGVQDVRYRLKYTMPRIYGSPFRLELFSEFRELANDYIDEPDQLREETKNGANLFRWMNLKNRSSGWYFGLGLYNEERKNQALNIGELSRPDLGGDFWGIRYGYKRVNEYLFNRRGKDYGYTLDTTRLLFEADQNYTRHELFYRSYYRLKSRPLNNLNVQLKLGVSEGDYLGDVEFSLGGKSLRGYDKALYSGNAMVVMNLEYLIPFSQDPAYRYGYIFDIGNTYERFEEIDLTRLHPAVGLAFRWKLAAFVKVDLRLDIGYGIDTGTSNFLLNSRHLF